MRNISTVLSAIALVLIGVLFYLHFSHPKNERKETAVSVSGQPKSFKLAYFDIDSLQEHYLYYNEALEQLKRQESSANAELQQLKAKIQKTFSDYQKKGQLMTQTEEENARQELGVMDQNYRRREAELQDQLQSRNLEFRNDMHKQIEDYLKVYNKNLEYALIISYEPNWIIYSRDSAYDITGDLIKGLNESYKSKKK